MGNSMRSYLKARGKHAWLRPLQVVMVGLDNAGKTTLLYRLKLDSFIQTVPTSAFNVELIKISKQLRINLWDVCGNDTIRPLWRTYLRRAEVVVFVLDSVDVQRFEEVSEEISDVSRFCERSGVPLLIIANKQDRPNAVLPLELVNRLELTKLGGMWHLHACSGKTGNGLMDGLLSIEDLIDKKRKFTRSKSLGSLEVTPITTKVSEFI